MGGSPLALSRTPSKARKQGESGKKVRSEAFFQKSREQKAVSNEIPLLSPSLCSSSERGTDGQPPLQGLGAGGFGVSPSLSLSLGLIGRGRCVRFPEGRKALRGVHNVVWPVAQATGFEQKVPTWKAERGEPSDFCRFPPSDPSVARPFRGHTSAKTGRERV